MNTTTMTEMHHQLAAVTAERDHWKANHDNRVNAARLLTERTDMPMERIGAYKQYMEVLEATQKMRDALIAAETELAKLREQKPVGQVQESSPSDKWPVMRTLGEFPPIGTYLYAAPIPAPAAECRGVPDRNCAYLAPCNSACNKCGKVHSPLSIPAPAVPAPTTFIPDDDTRRNDAEFAAQQAATAPSVPEEWLEAAQRLIDAAGDKTCSPLRCNYPMDCCSHELIGAMDAMSALLQSAKQAVPSVPDEWREKLIAEFPLFNDEGLCQEKHHCEWALQQDRKRLHALLKSANHSERNLEKVSPDCRACANRGRINGLSQESYCDSCIYQGRDWRQNHFVDARKMADAIKRRCEACAILPCSCK